MKKFILILLLFPFLVIANNKVEINTAALEKLQELIGIGPIYAQRIIDNRPFSSLDDLTKVKGIGEKTLEKIKEQGLAYINVEGLTKTNSPQILKESKPENLKIYAENIEFIEIMPSPEGSDLENEYIKLKNNNNFKVDLAGWIIRDKVGSIKEYILNQEMEPLQTIIVRRPESKITLNNSGDGLELLNPNKEIIDSVSFNKTVTGKPYLKINSTWQWGLLEKEATDIKKDTNNQEIKPRKAEESLIKENLKEEKSFFSTFLIAIVIALSSAIVFLATKTKIDKNMFLG